MRYWLVLVVGLFWPSVTLAQVYAFPSAEGFGRVSVGGRGGRVVRVTNREDSGPGSLRHALTQTYPRTVIFDVSGTIELRSNIVMAEANSFCTIAGQTSPGGVQIKGANAGSPGNNAAIIVYDGCHDVIIRHLRVRPGGYASANGDDDNAIVIYGPTRWTYNVIVDHCSISWGNDEMCSNYGLVENTTWQWNIIAEGVPVLPGAGFAFLADNWAPEADQPRIRFAVHHNLLVHNQNRNISAVRGYADFQNNIVYNWSGNNASSWGSKAHGPKGHSAKGNLINNIYVAGVDASPDAFFLGNGSSLGDRDQGGTQVYVEGNWSPNYPTGATNEWAHPWLTADYWPPEIRLCRESEFRTTTKFPSLIATEPTSVITNKIVARVGAYKPSRDSVDRHIIDHFVNRTGDLAHIGAGGPWAVLDGGAPPTDSDGDGMPDAWEVSHQLNPNDGADGPQRSRNGYTHLENYLNELAGDTVPNWSVPRPGPPQSLRRVL
ncbi:MAG: hypothetical protein ACKVPX_10680 [Myxococcaceae bacterium]